MPTNIVHIIQGPFGGYKQTECTVTIIVAHRHVYDSGFGLTMADPMDDDVVLKAIEGLDRESLSAVFEQYAPVLYRYALHLCHDPQEADNVVGDVFSRLLDQLAAGKGPRKNLRSYLYQTAYHIIVDNARDRKHHSSFEQLWNEDGTDILPPEQAEEYRKLGLLKAAINSVLTDDQKNVIVLRFLEGFDLRETADILDKEVNNVKVIQNRAIAKLREALSDELEDL